MTVPVRIVTIPPEHLKQAWQINGTWDALKLTFSRTEACLTVLGSETHDTDLGIVYSKTGLDIATADKLAKINEIKTIDEDEKQQSNTKKHNKQS